MGFENGILMVTEDTQKLCCDHEVFWGQLTPLSAVAKQAGCWRRKEPRGTRPGSLQAGSPARLQDIFRTTFSCLARFYLVKRNTLMRKVLGTNDFCRSFSLEGKGEL